MCFNNKLKSSTNDSDNLNEQETSIEQGSLSELKSEQICDDLSFASILGKTPSGLQTDFYRYEVEKLMSKIGVNLLLNDKNKSQTEELVFLSRKYGCKRVLLTPFCYCKIKNVLGIDFETCVALDYPSGESGLRSRLVGIRENVKAGASALTISVSFSYLNFGCLGDEKRKLNKLTKSTKKPLGITVNLNRSKDNISKLLRAFEQLKISCVYLDASEISNDDLQNILTVIKNSGFKKPLFVIKNVCELSDLQILTDGKADMLFTSMAHELGEKIYRKFSLE